MALITGKVVKPGYNQPLSLCYSQIMGQTPDTKSDFFVTVTLSKCLPSAH